METYESLTDYHLLTKVLAIETSFGGRKHSLVDGYRGQFFWHINDNGVNCSDWDALYYFKGGEVIPGNIALCKILLSKNLLRYSGGDFREGAQFGIREGPRIVAVGVIESNKLIKSKQRSHQCPPRHEYLRRRAIASGPGRCRCLGQR